MAATANSGGVCALRGTIITCRDDPFLAEPLKAFAVETDGIVVCRNGLNRECRARGGDARNSCTRRDGDRLHRLPDRARLHRYACALCADRDRRLLRHTAARL